MMMMMVVMITMMVMKEGRGRGQKGRGLSEGRGLRDGFEEGGEKGGGVKRGEGFERGNSPFSIPTLSSNTPKKIISLTPFFCFFFFFSFHAESARRFVLFGDAASTSCYYCLSSSFRANLYLLFSKKRKDSLSNALSLTLSSPPHE